MPSQPFMGEIFIAAYDFPPRGYGLCQGQLLPINQNQSLFALLGTTFGGDGRVNFALPNMRGRMPMDFGLAPGLSQRILGEASGTESVTLLTTQLPAHNHALSAVNIAGDVSNPNGALLANSGALDKEYKVAPHNSPVQMHTSSVGNAGGNQPHHNMPPFLVLNFYISLDGVFPSPSP